MTILFGAQVSCGVQMARDEVNPLPDSHELIEIYHMVCSADDTYQGLVSQNNNASPCELMIMQYPSAKS